MDTTGNKVSIPATIKTKLLTSISNEIGVAINFALDEKTSDKEFWKLQAEQAREAYGWIVNNTIAA